MPLWATIDDVRNRWIGDDVPCDAAKIEAWINDAETLIVAEYPDLADRIDDLSLPVERVRLVVARMVSRAFRNPTGTRQRQETTGPFSASLTYAGDSPGDLWLTAEERTLLSGIPGAHRPRAFTIGIAPADGYGQWVAPDVWVPVT